MNYSFYALFVTLIGMLFLTGGNIHVCALFGLSVGLFLSIKWWVGVGKMRHVEVDIILTALCSTTSLLQVLGADRRRRGGAQAREGR
jgi:hypothetical protein